MKIIVCLDDNFGMMFNNRRQSRDKAVIDTIIKITANSKLWISSYSLSIFGEFKDNIIIDENFLKRANTDDYCFNENQSMKTFLDKINQIIIFKWNRKYPADFYFDIPLNSFKLTDKIEIFGSSHDKITMEIYDK